MKPRYDETARRLPFVLAVLVLGMVVARLLAGDEEPEPSGTANREFVRPADVQALQTGSGICPQKRATRRAPDRYYHRTNPLDPNPRNLERGRVLYYEEAKPTPCVLCHGKRGNGNGKLAPNLEPPPRNFTCQPTMKTIPDGQMFWIIRNGSRGTAMPAHESTLSEKETWQLILFVRQFAELESSKKQETSS